MKYFIYSVFLVCLSLLFAGCTSSVDVAKQQPVSTLNSQNETQTNSHEVETDREPGFSNTANLQLNDVVEDYENSNGTIVTSIRKWRDRDSQFSTNAELLEISLESKTVKLLKDNGITITVPISRLSRHDRKFLAQYAASHSKIHSPSP